MEEGVRLNTEVLVAVLSLVGIWVGLLGGHLLGRRRTKFERLYEQRALVIAELTRRLGRFRRTALLAANRGEQMGDD